MNPEVAYPSYKPYSLSCSDVSSRQIMQLLRIIESCGDCRTLESLVFSKYLIQLQKSTPLWWSTTSSGDPNLPGLPLHSPFLMGCYGKRQSSWLLKCICFLLSFLERRYVGVCAGVGELGGWRSDSSISKKIHQFSLCKKYMFILKFWNM